MASTLAAAEAVSHPTVTSVYVDRQGSMVRVRGDRLVVTDGDELLLRLNLRRVRQVCYGRVNLTTAFMHPRRRAAVVTNAALRGLDLPGQNATPEYQDNGRRWLLPAAVFVY
jgi:CRISPR associated protein Cas1